MRKMSEMSGMPGYARRNDGLGEEYIIVSRPDIESLSRLLTIARGKLSIDKFGGKTGVSMHTLYGIQHKRRVSNVSFSAIKKIAEGSEDKSVTIDELMAANGMSFITSKAEPVVDDVREKQDQVVDMVSQVPDTEQNHAGRKSKKQKGLTRSEIEDALFGEVEPSKDPYKDFIVNLSYYSVKKPEEHAKFLFDRKDRYYGDEAIKRMLRNFRCKSAEDEQRRIEGLRKYFTTGLEKDFPGAKSYEYEHVLDEILLGKEPL